jgi:hypothetical protein
VAEDGWDLDRELGALDRWAAEQRVAEAVGQRRRAEWLARQPAAELTLPGLLVALAEQGRPIVVEVTDGRRHRGSPTVVGRDVVELRTAADRVVLVALHAIRSLRVTGEPLADAAMPVSRPGTDLAEELARRAEDRPDVWLVTDGATEPVVGSLVAAGPQVVTLRLPGGDVAYVPLAALAEVSLPESG